MTILPQRWVQPVGGESEFWWVYGLALRACGINMPHKERPHHYPAPLWLPVESGIPRLSPRPSQTLRALVGTAPKGEQFTLNASWGANGFAVTLRKFKWATSPLHPRFSPPPSPCPAAEPTAHRSGREMTSIALSGLKWGWSKRSCRTQQATIRRPPIPFHDSPMKDPHDVTKWPPSIMLLNKFDDADSQVFPSHIMVHWNHLCLKCVTFSYWCCSNILFMTNNFLLHEHFKQTIQ